MKICLHQDWGIIPYDQAHNKQLELFNHKLQQKLKAEPVESLLVICEHPSVITMGKNANQSNILAGLGALENRGVSLHKTERGGDVTFHGPGQCVVYPVFDIDDLDMGVRAFIYSLEEVIIRVLAKVHIHAERRTGYTGVWLGEGSSERKIAAIGVKCSRGITMHGFALNINTDLRNFELIVPCGIAEKKVTSIKNELGFTQNINQFHRLILKSFEEVFGFQIVKQPSLLT